MSLEQVILDEDGGGDTLQALLMLTAWPHKTRLLGLTTAFGNIDHDTALKNNGALLRFAGVDHIPYFPGSLIPSTREILEGDGAHGGDGKGGVILPPVRHPPQNKTSVDFMLNTLRENPANTITIVAAAPQTSLATALAREPETVKRVKRIVIMGGCTAAMQAADMPHRQGNITPQAEFNFYMAAADARAVMGSGLPITLLPMNATHQMTLTPARARMIRDALPGNRGAAETLVGLMRAPADIDRRKFGIDPVMHDIHTALCLMFPEHYAGRCGTVEVVVADPAAPDSLNGHTMFRPDPYGTTTVIEQVKGPDFLFAQFLTAVRHRFGTPAPRDEARQLIAFRPQVA